MNRKLPLVLALVALILVAGVLLSSGAGRAPLLAGVEWLRQQGGAGIALFAGVYVLSVVVFMPAAWSAAIAGYVYGLGLGLLISLPCMLAGALLTFVVGRFLARDTVAAFAARRPLLRAIDAALGRGGYRLVVLLRLCVPHNVLNYGLSASRVDLGAYMLGTALGGPPITVAFCVAGSLAASAAEVLRAKERLGSWPLVLGILGGLVGVAVLAWLVRAARRELARELEKVRESAHPPA